MLKKITVVLFALFSAFSAQAGLVSNEDLYTQNLRGQVLAQLDQPVLIEAMTAHGISHAEAEARIQNLTADELASLSAQFDELPAGGESFMTFIIVTFAILVVTDALGYTDFFPFVKGPE